MRMTQRQAVLLLLGLQIIGTLLLTVVLIATRQDLVPIVASLISVPVYGVLLWAYWRGWDYARYLIVAVAVLVIGIGLPEPFVTTHFALLTLLPPILALTLTNTAWIIGSAVALVFLLLIRAGGHGVYIEPVRLASFILAIIGLVLSRLVIEAARREAEENAQHSAAERERAERQAEELAQRNDELTRQNSQQQRLLDLVAALELPVIPVGTDVLVVPLVGNLDQQRLTALEGRLLEAVTRQRARTVVLDVTGVTILDTSAAEGLLRTTQAVRLLGARTIISGINAPMAQTMVSLNLPLDSLDTMRDLGQALSHLTERHEPAPEDGA